MKKINKKSNIACLLCTSCLALASNPEPVIYGTITHSNGESVTGTIRWGQQEQFLSDIFNGKKVASVGIEHLTDDEKEQILDNQPGPQAQIGDLQITFKSFFGKEIELPYFNVFFGSIKKIDIANDVIITTLHDDTKIIGNDGSNDFSDEIFIKNSEGETVEFDIDDLKKIEFSAAPADAKRFAKGIYGTVISSMGTFSGRIIWDKDERTTDKELDGSDETEEHEIKFSQIVGIEKAESGSASKVSLRDGQTLLLKGTNDVNNSNRGIWVNDPVLGRVEIDWSQFEKLTIEDIDVTWKSFDDYKSASKKLKGKVVLIDGTSVQADELVYDLNQQSQSELLYADIGGNNRQVPLSQFKSFSRIDDQSIELETHDKKQFIAYNNRSVTIENNGIVVTTGTQHKWYSWSKVKSIELE